MKQLVILSGKGGTGKTCVTAAFAHLSASDERSITSVFVDADVDAANLSLVLDPEDPQTHEFWGGSLAEIDQSMCIGCGACVPVCRYDAILPDFDHGQVYLIDPVACDGCAACVYACPEEAISMVKQQEGHWYKSKTPYGILYHAELFPGRENSGKLVTLIKQMARMDAEETGSKMVIIDGPPGIGCPVISACAGADLGLIVTEPSMAGLHDLKRVLGTLQHFHVPTMICINKWDIYPDGVRQIQEYAAQQDIELLGLIPFDDHILDAMLQGLPVTVLYPDSPSAQAIISIWDKVVLRLQNDLEK